MVLGYLSALDWQECFTLFPGVESFLLGRALQRELVYLRGMSAPTDWQTARLAELEQWAINTKQENRKDIA